MGDEEFVVKGSPTPLVIYDWMVHAHHVYEWVKVLKPYVSESRWRNLALAAWVYSLNRGPEMLTPPEEGWRVVIVRDCKDSDGHYWRKEEGENDPELQAAWDAYLQGKHRLRKYKGHRSSRPEDFWTVEKIGRAYADKFFPHFAEEGFEADDWAGTAYRLHESPEGRQMFLYTVDRDWSMLVDDSRGIYFANSRRPRANELDKQRLVDNEAVVDHTLRKMKMEISHPRELAFAKSVKGDMGDNLPPGAPVYLFDLCEPPMEWRLENYSPEKVKSFKEELSSKEPNTRADHLDRVREAFPDFLEGVSFKHIQSPDEL